MTTAAIPTWRLDRRFEPKMEETRRQQGIAGWRDAVERIGNDASIDEVILSGGDPRSLSTAKLAERRANARHASTDDLPGVTYCVGFTRAYANAVGLDGGHHHHRELPCQERVLGEVLEVAPAQR